MYFITILSLKDILNKKNNGYLSYLNDVKLLSMIKHKQNLHILMYSSTKHCYMNRFMFENCFK